MGRVRGGGVGLGGGRGCDWAVLRCSHVGVPGGEGGAYAKARICWGGWGRRVSGDSL